MGTRFPSFLLVAILGAALGGCLAPDAPKDVGPTGAAGENLEGADEAADAWQRAPNLAFRAKGFTGDLALGVTVRFFEKRTCNYTIAGSGEPRDSSAPIVFWGEEWKGAKQRGLTLFALGEGTYVHLGPVDTRPATDEAVRVVQSILGGNAARVTLVDAEFGSTWTFRLMGQKLVPHRVLGGASLVLELECDGDFEWGSFTGSHVVAGFNTASFQGTGLSAGYVKVDRGSALELQLAASHVRGAFLDWGSVMDSGTLELAHPDGRVSWNFPGESYTAFEGRGGAYRLALERTRVTDESWQGIFYGSDETTWENLTTPGDSPPKA